MVLSLLLVASKSFRYRYKGSKCFTYGKWFGVGKRQDMSFVNLIAKLNVFNMILV